MLQLSFTQIAALLSFSTSIFASPVAIPLTASAAVSCPSSDGKTITAGSATFTIACKTDYYGGDLSMSWETSIEHCAATCASTTGCIVVSYNGGACYMKSKIISSQANDNVWSAVKVVATTPSTDLKCPSSDGTTYATKTGGIFKVECGIDRYGSDMPMSWETSFTNCVETCGNTAGCVDVSYRSGSPGPCYMKSSFDQSPRLDKTILGAVRTVQRLSALQL